MRTQQQILVVDDEETIASMIAEALMDEDFNVLVASNGQMGIDLACRHHPNLILTDVMMPNMDGLRMAESIRTELGLNMPPIIFMSAVDCRTETQVLGSFLAKPFTLDMLFNAVESQLR